VNISLDGIRYNVAPNLLALDKIPSPNDGNSTLLVINPLDGNLAIGVNPIRGVMGTLFDDVENGFEFSSSWNKTQFKSVLSDTFPQTTPVFSQVIKSGSSGWMRFMVAGNRAISGAVINFHPNAAARKGAFSGGRNLNHLRFTGTSFSVPVFEPNC